MKPEQLAKIHANMFINGHYEDSGVAEDAYLIDCKLNGFDIFSEEVGNGFSMIRDLIISMSDHPLEDQEGNKISTTKH